MKIYKVNIDTTQPIRQSLRVPVGETKYGIAVSVMKGDHTIRNLSCNIDVGGSTIEPTKRLDDGSFLFELQSTDGNYIAKVHVTAEPTKIPETTYSGRPSGAVINKFATAFALSAGTYYNDEFNPYGWRNSGVPNQSYPVFLVFNDAAETNITRMVYNSGDPNKNVWFQSSSDGKITTLPLDTNLEVYSNTVSCGQWLSLGPKKSITVAASYLGYHVDSYIDVVLNSSKDALPDMIIDDPVDFTNVDATNLSADNFTLSGVTYVPTTLTIDGIDYKVLAAEQPTPDPEELVEPTEG